MKWQDESEVGKWPSVTDRLRWAQNNYGRYNLEEKARRRLALLLNLLTIDAMIQSEGGESLLPKELVTGWFELYEAYRPTLLVGRPPKGSS